MRLIRGPLAAQLEVLPVPLVEKPYYLVFSRGFARQHAALAERIWNTIGEVRDSPAYRQRERALTAAQSLAAGGRH